MRAGAGARPAGAEPGWSRWQFGRPPWWGGRGSPPRSAVLSGVTDATGAHLLHIDLLSVDPPFATSLRAEAQVSDLTRQIGSAGVDLIVHPAALNVGLRVDRAWLHPGQTAELEVVIVDHALVDPLPAGFEPLNPELRGTGFTDDPDGGVRGPRRSRGDFWRPYWFEHQNLRDDRAEAFASLLPAGAYEYSYLARATTPGTFVVPPARAEMMYEPETFGRGEGHMVLVEER